MEKNALVVIDVQNYFINDSTKHLPEKIASFISKNNFDFIIFTKCINKEGSNFFKILNWKKCTHPPETNIHPALEQFTSPETVFQKTSFSIFKSKKLVNFLDENNIKNISLCGLDIDACVLASAFDAFDLGYNFEICEDISKSHYGKSLDQAALKIINKNLKRK